MTAPGPESEVRPLDRFLCRWADAARRRAILTLVLVTIATVGLGFYAVSHLSFNVDPNSFFSQDLRFQHAIRKFEQYFPVLTNSLLVVVDGETPEITRAAAEQLVAALDEQRELFRRAFQPGEDRFFERYGLLYGSLEDLDDFADHLALMQPVLGELARDMSLPTLTRVIQLGLEQEDSGTTGVEGWRSVLGHLRTAMDSVRLGDERALSWESVLIAGSGYEPLTRSVVVADPILDLERVLAAERAFDAVRATAEHLGLTPEQGVRVRITGYPAINHEEMIGLASDTAVAGTASFLLVILVLARAFRSWRLVLGAAITLIIGLVWAAAFAGATVGELNPMSICFGVLVIGLGIDFMIHLGMHLLDHILDGETIEAAVVGSVADTGRALVLCAGTTSVGFLAFVPTDFRGISDLGLAAVGGMLAILFLTLTLFPALISLLVNPMACARLHRHGGGRGIHLPRLPNPTAVVAIAALAALAALPLLPRVDLETNVISIRNQKTESVQTFRDLLESQRTTPWFLDALVPTLEQAVELAADMRKLPQVDLAYTLADFAPEQQQEKIAILQDVEMMLGLPATVARAPKSVVAQRAALKEFADFLESRPLANDSPLAPDIAALHRSLAEFLEATAGEPDGSSTGELADIILEPLPGQIERLMANLEVEPISREDLPPTMIERMLSEDGQARIQVYPSGDLWSHDVMVDFVESIRPIWGEITGLPVNLVESARATWHSLRSALIGSAIAIGLLLLSLWRSISDTAIVLGPLLLAVLLCQAATVVLPIPFNFGNVIVLPLLLGIGVDSGIHLVQRANSLGADSMALMGSTTARAVFFSALTTVASFGSLAVSAHLGVSSLGLLLVVGMILTLLANLVILPALLTLMAKRRAGRGQPGRS
jgi:hopanoid biosynthesis associated RND transporter like protein HpnN